jgi:hypothetical protein
MALGEEGLLPFEAAGSVLAVIWGDQAMACHVHVAIALDLLH